MATKKKETKKKATKKEGSDGSKFTPQPGEGEGDVIECTTTGDFGQWMAQSNGSLIITTYQAGKVALVGWLGNQVSLMMRTFRKPMGVAVSGPRIALATRFDIWMFANAPMLAYEFMEDQPDRYDALYLPRLSYHTNDLNVHDLAFGKDGLWIVNTRFSCLSMMSVDYNFLPRWHPPFLTQVAPEDRCHLNGLAMIDGEPGYVTALGYADSAGGWRDDKAVGGIVIDVRNNEIVKRGLSMPHSPRWHDGKLWVLNSGAGELWVLDPQRFDHTVVCALTGYLRGLCFVGPFALIGMSKIREEHIFGDLPIQKRHKELLCGVAVVDTRNGQSIGTFEFTAGCTEMFEVQFLPGVQRPMILNLEHDDFHDAISAPEFAYWLRPSKLISDETTELTQLPQGRRKE